MRPGDKSIYPMIRCSINIIIVGNAFHKKTRAVPPQIIIHRICSKRIEQLHASAISAAIKYRIIINVHSGNRIESIITNNALTDIDGVEHISVNIPLVRIAIAADNNTRTLNIQEPAEAYCQTGRSRAWIDSECRSGVLLLLPWYIVGSGCQSPV